MHNFWWRRGRPQIHHTEILSIQRNASGKGLAPLIIVNGGDGGESNSPSRRGCPECSFIGEDEKGRKPVWRKYNLGAIIVTQQPGAISDQLLSQGDNFFALHLVSSVDLDALKRNNAHFSDDILSYILNEPIEGNAYFWLAPSQSAEDRDLE